MIYGYCRISKKTQDITRQERNITAIEPKAKLYFEAYTGTTTERPEYQKLLKKLKKGDTVLFDSVSRMSRNSEEGVKDYFTLYEKGVELIFLKEPYINSEVYRKATEKPLEEVGHKIADLYIKATNEALKLLAEEQIEIAFKQAEKEVLDLQQRTKEGLRTARAKGKKVGRPSGADIITQKEIDSKKLMRLHCKSFGGSMTNETAMNFLKLSRNTFYKYLKQLKEED
ncbi:MAG: recombinase family protein [Fusobacteriaceae bacterium]